MLIAAKAQTPASMPLLSPVFGDHMVLQRDRPNTFWGWAAPGTPVTVRVEGRTGRGIADATGKWKARLTPPPTGGPYRVEIDGPSHIVLNDVLVGDVWVCSGQSNMEMGVAQVNNAQAEIAAADHPGIRLYMVPKVPAFDPQPLNPGTWAVCNPENIATGGWGGFSAVGYFFGRELNRRLNVPIGLVEDCWGGTIAEAWTSREGLRPLKDFDAGIARIDELKKNPGVPMDRQVAEWFSKNDPGSASSWQSPSFDDSNWKATGSLTNFSDIGLDKFDGLVWYRTVLDLPDGSPTDGATLNLGKIDDADTTWVNGVRVGGINAWDASRSYSIPAGVLKPGRNVIAIRVLDTGAGGGLYSPASDMGLKLSDGRTLGIGGNWKVNVTTEISKLTPFPQDLSNNPNVPTVLYNGMISPILPLAIKGAIWYQGESNAGRAKQYQSLLPAMIKDWRKQWNQGDFPFFIVQLANFMAPPTEPTEDAWAELREAQAMTARNVKNSGLAVAIDIGDAADIHPKDKQNVGYRLALATLHTAYGQDLTYSGPTYKSMKREGDSIRISFDHTNGGLKLKRGDTRLVGFAIAGKDGKFHWATAEIQGSTVVVRSPDVPAPVAVRYAWAANPPANLYNGSDLPAVPFRTK